MNATPQPSATRQMTANQGAANEHLATALTSVLADSFTLMVKTQGVHWNVVGPLFVSVHELTEQHYQNLFGAVDEIAERVRALHHPAPGSMSALLALSSIEEGSAANSAEGMVSMLVRDHQAIVGRLREAIEIAENTEDDATADMLLERVQFHEKAIWMLEAIVS